MQGADISCYLLLLLPRGCLQLPTTVTSTLEQNSKYVTTMCDFTVGLLSQQVRDSFSKDDRYQWD